MLSRLQKLNRDIKIKDITSREFTQYGKLLKNYDFSETFTDVKNAEKTDGPTYYADIKDLHKYSSINRVKDSIFGEIEIQAGICFGNNTKMNGMEYHKSSEVIVAVTDVVLILGDFRDINNNTWDSSLAKVFYIPKDTAIELYAGTMHLAPCRVDSNPFSTIIILPKETNTSLENKNSDDKLLFMKNKWLICHKESPAVARGAYIGIKGNNININC